MPKSATDVLQEIIFSAVIDSVVSLKEASKGVPNALLRDLNAIHPNVTLADMPPPVQAAIAASVRAAFVRLQKEGYAVTPSDSVQPPAPGVRGNTSGGGLPPSGLRSGPRTGKGPPPRRR